MGTITVDAERAFALFFELFKAKPWLNQPGVMRSEDSIAETEAVAFLLAAMSTNEWDGCSPPAQRIVNSLLLDFMAKLQSPKSSISRSTWEVKGSDPEWRQALDVVAQEIRKSHPPLAVRH